MKSEANTPDRLMWLFFDLSIAVQLCSWMVYYTTYMSCPSMDRIGCKQWPQERVMDETSVARANCLHAILTSDRVERETLEVRIGLQASCAVGSSDSLMHTREEILCALYPDFDRTWVCIVVGHRSIAITS